MYRMDQQLERLLVKDHIAQGLIVLWGEDKIRFPVCRLHTQWIDGLTCTSHGSVPSTCKACYHAVIVTLVHYCTVSMLSTISQKLTLGCSMLL